MTAVIGPVVKYPGAKWKIIDGILPFFPEHDCYLEPYFGSGAALFSKRQSVSEIVNDISSRVVRLYEICRDPVRRERLIEAIEFTPWARVEFDLARVAEPESGDEIEDARVFLVQFWQGIGTRYRTGAGWRLNTKKSGRSASGAWSRLPDRIRLAGERLQHVQIECKPALEVIRQCNGPQVLIYADPTYLIETRSDARDMYEHEMTVDDHIELLETLERHSGPVVLSGYPSALYSSIIPHWFEVSLRGYSQGHQTETPETIWLNGVARARLRNQPLFGSIA